MRAQCLSRYCVVILAMVALISFGDFSDAQEKSGDHEPPRTVLTADGQEQRGYRVSWCWSTSSFDFACYDRRIDFSGPIVATTRDISIRIHKEQRPQEVGIISWRRLNDDGVPRGREELEASIEPVGLADGEILAWDVTFTLPRGWPHYYIGMQGEWMDEDFPPRDQSAVWTFHVRT